MATTYIDDVLIKLRRQYSLDETVSALNKRLTEIEIKLGQANSYIDELEYEKNQKSLKNGGQEWFEKYSKLKERFEKLEKELNSDDKYFEISYKNKLLIVQNKKLTNQLQKNK